MTGLPHKNRRIPTLRYVSTDRTSSTLNTTKIGSSPASSGVPVSCIGTAARFAISIVTTNSIGSISPSCRLPMSRTTRISARYKTTARMSEISIKNASLP